MLEFHEQLKESVLHYASMGYRVFPLVPGAKVPRTKHGFKEATTNLEQVEKWWTIWPDSNIGICTEGTLVVDIDGANNSWPNNPDHAADLVNSPTSVTANGGHHHVFRPPPGVSYRSTAGRLAESVDTRADGGYIVAAPSRLENGKQYCWVEGLELVPLEKLPVVPRWLQDQLDHFSREQSNGPLVGDREVIPDGQRNSTLTRLAGVMRRAGMGRSEIFAALRQTNESRCNPPLDEGEVFRIAHSICRYEPDQATVAVVHGHFEQLFPGDSEPGIGPGISPTNPGTFPDHLCDVPGLVNDIQNYIYRISHRPQPILALGASLSLCSLIFGRKVMDDIGTRPNLYSLGVAPSGGGKEAARKAIKDLLLACGKDRLIGEGIASHAGLVNAMNDNPSTIWLVDEFGRILRSITAAGVNAPHLAGIITNLLKLYSSSASIYLGDAYADRDKRVTINQPNCVLYATTVPESLYQGLTAESITDGLLARMLLWESPSTRPPMKSPETIDLTTGFFYSLVNRINWWADWNNTGGNLNDTNPRPERFALTPEAQAMIHRLAIESDAKILIQGEPLGTLWTRNVEKARKLALVYSCSKWKHDQPKEITVDAIRWASNVANWHTERLIYLAHQWISDGSFDLKRKKVLRALEAAGSAGCTGTELARKTQSLSPRERTEVIQSLFESCEITTKKTKTDKAGRPTMRYYLATINAQEVVKVD